MLDNLLPEHAEAIDTHLERLTKRYIIDYLNVILFSNSVLWDGADQFNELPIFNATKEDGYRVEQRGALFVSKQFAKALRMIVSVTESAVQQVCYRITGIKEPVRIDEGKRMYYPLDGPAIDVSIANLNLGIKDPSSYSFCDNTNNTGKVSNARLAALLRHVIGSAFITLEDEDLFHDLLSDRLSLPPIPSDPHYKPIYGVADASGNRD